MPPADVPLPPDRRDVVDVLGRSFYDRSILTPSDVVMSEPAADRLRL